MRCTGCGAELKTGAVFPGAEVTCAVCGVSERVSVPSHARTGEGFPPTRLTGECFPPTPYRAAAPTPAPASPARGEARRYEEARRPCPRCKHGLDEVDACLACGGRFVDHDALAVMIDEARHEIRAEGQRAHVRVEREVRYLECPSCRERMDRMMFGKGSKVIVDVCRAHGTWFDTGELERVLEWVSGGGTIDVGAVRVEHQADALARFEALRVSNEAEREARAITDGIDDVLDLIGARPRRRY